MTEPNQIVPAIDLQALIAGAFDDAVRSSTFSDYCQRKAPNTLRRQRADLGLFANYLTSIGFLSSPAGAAERFQSLPAAWSGITYGILAGFVQWQLQQGYALASINVRLSTLKQYAKLAFTAGVIAADQHTLIRTVTGYAHKEQRKVDEKRLDAGLSIRVGVKKSSAIRLTHEQIGALKAPLDTPQGRRDGLMMCLLLDHGLRCGELAILTVDAFHLSAGTFTFYRPKVNKQQTHRLTVDTLRAAHAYFDSGDAPSEGRLLRSSRKDGSLTHAGMTERAITLRVNTLGRGLGVETLSAHDGRHNWATDAAESGTREFALQEGGGWNSLAMPRHYVKAAEIANQGVVLNR